MRYDHAKQFETAWIGAMTSGTIFLAFDTGGRRCCFRGPAAERVPTAGRSQLSVTRFWTRRVLTSNGMDE
jgi:hypothetical protein